MRVRITLIDREGDNDPVEVKFREKVNGVRDDKSGAKGAAQMLGKVLGLINSPLGATLAVNIASLEALLQKQAAEAVEQTVEQVALDEESFDGGLRDED